MNLYSSAALYEAFRFILRIAGVLKPVVTTVLCNFGGKASSVKVQKSVLKIQTEVFVYVRNSPETISSSPSFRLSSN